MRFVLFFIIVFSVTLAFGQNDRLLVIADSLWTQYQNEKQNPKKAIILGKISSIIHPYFPDSSFSLALKGLSIAQTNKDKEGAALNNLSIGFYYWSIGKFSLALSQTKEALEWYEKTNDLRGKARGYYLLGNIYTGISEYQKSLEYYQKAYSIYKTLSYENEIDGELRSLTTIGMTYGKIKQYDTAIFIINKALELGKKRGINNVLDRAYVLWSLGSVYLNKGNPENAYKYFLSSIEENKNPPYMRLQSLIYTDISKALWQMKKYTEAIDACKHAMSIAQQFGLLPELRSASMELSEYFQKNRNFEQALKYGKISALAKDSMLSIQKLAEIKALEYSYETKKKETEVLLLQQQTKSDRIILLLLTLLIMTIVMVTLITFRKQREINRIKMRELELVNKNVQAELKIKTLDALKLETELDLKNQELTSLALNIVQKTETFNHIHEEIKKLKSISTKENQSQLNTLSSIINSSRKLDKDWEKFKLYFEQVHNGFFDNLCATYPDLTSKEIRLCALLKLNLDTKQIATILEISPESAKMARYRIRKKLGLSGEENLVNFFNRFNTN